MAKVPEMQFLNDEDMIPFLLTFIYGHSGAGKTVLAASACEVPEMSPVLLIDCSTSAETLLGEPRFEGVDILRVKTYDDISKVHTWLHPKGGNHVADYSTIIIDEVDKLHWKALMNRVSAQKRENPDREMFDIWQNDYGDARAMLINLITHFIAFERHLILTSLVRVKEDLVDKREYRMTSLAGQLRDDIPALMGMYLYLDVQVPSSAKGDDFEGRRIAYTTTTRKYKGKVRGLARAKRFGTEVEEPTMQKLYDLYFNL